MKTEARPVFFDFRDRATGTRNSMLTARGTGVVSGIELLFERDSLGEGLFFRRAADGKEFAVREYMSVTPNEIRFKVPALVRPGIFSLILRKMRNNQPVEVKLPRGLEFTRKPVLTNHRAVFVRTSPALPRAPYHLFRGALMELRGANLNLHNRSGYELVLLSETGSVSVVEEFYNPAGNECRIRYRVPCDTEPGPHRIGIRYRDGGKFWLECIPRKYIVMDDALFPITREYESNGVYNEGLYRVGETAQVHGANLEFATGNKKEGVFFVCADQGKIVRADVVESVEEDRVRFQMPHAGRGCFLVLVKHLKEGLFTSEPIPLQEWADFYEEAITCQYNIIS